MIGFDVDIIGFMHPMHFLLSVQVRCLQPLSAPNNGSDDTILRCVLTPMEMLFNTLKQILSQCDTGYHT